MVGGLIFISTLGFHGSGLTPFLEMTSIKSGTHVHLQGNLSLFHFRFTCLHVCRTSCNVSPWFLPSLLYPSTKMSSAKPNTFGKPLNILSMFLWNIYPVRAAPNRSLLYLLLPNWHVNVLRYDHLSSCARLWYSELASIRENILHYSVWRECH